MKPSEKYLQKFRLGVTLLIPFMMLVTSHTKAQFTVPALVYAYNALEPYIDAQTMKLHHDNHHTAYVKKLNAEVSADEDLQGKTVEDICKKVKKYNKAVRDNAGGHYNHSLFWTLLSPKGGAPSAELLEDIKKTFGSVENFKTVFADSAKTRFGSGWAWVIVCPKGKLKITTTANQDNPLMDVVEERGTPVLALDVWEHAYYLKYNDKRVDYIAAFWSVVNWNEVNRLYADAHKK